VPDVAQAAGERNYHGPATEIGDEQLVLVSITEGDHADGLAVAHVAITRSIRRGGLFSLIAHFSAMKAPIGGLISLITHKVHSFFAMMALDAANQLLGLCFLSKPWWFIHSRKSEVQPETAAGFVLRTPKPWPTPA
jgi:hypothetical protein